MTFTILSDDDITKTLKKLSPRDGLALTQSLEVALMAYSCQGEQKYQPHRGVVNRPDGQVSLFMPATTQETIGVKIVGIAPSKPDSLASGSSSVPSLRSVLTLCDATGHAIGVLNAAELTAFRTALGSMLLFRLRRNVSNILVFGAGKQALWHIRLAVLFRGQDIRRITIINRSQERAQQLVDDLLSDKEAEWPPQIVVQVSQGTTLEELVTEADAIFCTTPATRPLFPAAYLSAKDATSKGRFISAIGSYRLDMAEIDPELLEDVANPSGTFSSQVWEGRIVVDSRDGCMQEAGEVVTAGIDPEQLLEIGQLLESKAPPLAQKEWLQTGFVIYKSVGIGIMDNAIGHQLLKIATSKNLGYSLERF